MSRKTHLISATAAIAASTALIAVAAQATSAQAQQAETAPAVNAPIVEETVPAFVSEEVVQPLPEPTEDIQDKAPAMDAGSLREMIAQMETPGELSRQMECLAGTVYFEARGEPIHGQLAVAQVVINRAESNVFPSDYCGVVYQRAQFSFVKNGRMPRIKRSSVAWQRAKKIARIAHEGMWESEAEDSLYFHAKYVKPRWSYRKQHRATIDTHLFYR